MSIQLSWAPHGIYRTYAGYITAQELSDTVTRAHVDPRYDDVKFQISDLLGITGFENAQESVEELAALVFGAVTGHRKICMAYVATDPQVIEIVQLARSVIGDGCLTGLFPTVQEAEAWVHKTLNAPGFY